MITVYTKPDCSQCEHVKMWLTWAQVPFETVDGTEPATLENIKLAGFQSFPITTVDGSFDNAFSGFDSERLNELKEKYGKKER